MPDANGKSPTPPYVPYKTFVAVLDGFAKFLPSPVDASVWPSYSGGMRSQLLGALRFLRLISSDGTPTPELKKLADAQEGRPAILKEVLTQAYPDLMKLDLSKATPTSFDSEMRKFQQDAEVHRKAVAFFIACAKAAAIPLSPLLLKKGTRIVRKPKRGAGKSTNGAAGSPTPIEEKQYHHSGHHPTRTVELENGITLSLSTSVDTLGMTKTDREFVHSLLDLIDEYEAEADANEEDKVDEASA